ncbi:MAG TPA: flagellar motor protein MotB [Alphaproteobacteria bacterium]|nr:flagellar motor protein MotB [Alphaproteobacteria bacterium]
MSEEQVNEEKEKEQGDANPVAPPRRFGRRMGDFGAGSQSMWLVSFTDVMALMLTFFVLMFAMSNPKKEEWEDFTQNIQQNFNRFQGQEFNRGKEDAVNIEKINFSQALDLNYLKALINNLLQEEPSLKVARLIDNGDSLIISLPHDLLFDPGQAVVKSEANKALFTIAGTLDRIKNRVEVVGHTDPRPINGSDFPSNWELSLARAANVAAVLENVGYEKQIAIRGQASGRFDDIPETVPVSERLDLSRRVDIVVMEDDGRKTKLFDIGLP